MTAGPPPHPDHQQEGMKIHKIAPAGELSDLRMIKAYRKGKSAR
jgi:hypothetical protein